MQYILTSISPVKYADLVSQTLLIYAELDPPSPLITQNQTPFTLSIFRIAKFQLKTGVVVSSSG